MWADFIANRQLRAYFSALLILSLAVVVVVYLTHVEIPKSNHDMVIMFISALAGGLVSALPKLLGESDDEFAKVKKDLDKLTVQYVELKTMYDNITSQLIAKMQIESKT